MALAKETSLANGLAVNVRAGISCKHKLSPCPPVVIGLFRAALDKVRALSLARPGCIFIDLQGRVLACSGAVFQLPRKRFDILAALLAARGTLLSVESLTAHVWGDDSDGGPENPRVAISHELTLCRAILSWLRLRVENSHGLGWRCCFSVIGNGDVV